MGRGDHHRGFNEGFSSWRVMRRQETFDLCMPHEIDEKVLALGASDALGEEQVAWGEVLIQGGCTAPADQTGNPLSNQRLGMPLSRIRTCTRNSQPMPLRQWRQAFKGQSTADEGPSLVRKRDEDADRLHVL